MGRKAQFTDEAVFGWLARRLVAVPAVTVQEVSRGTGVSVGSLYYRYGSLDGLLIEARLWALRRYHQRVIPILEATGFRRGVRAALQVLACAVETPEEAMLIFVIPRHGLVSPRAPEALRIELAAMEAREDALIAAYIAEVGVDPVAGWLALRDLPCAVVSRALPGPVDPISSENAIRIGFRALSRPSATSDASIAGAPLV